MHCASGTTKVVHRGTPRHTKAYGTQVGSNFPFLTVCFFSSCPKSSNSMGPYLEFSVVAAASLNFDRFSISKSTFGFILVFNISFVFFCLEVSVDFLS